jgi:hypothetical protein
MSHYQQLPPEEQRLVADSVSFLVSAYQAKKQIGGDLRLDGDEIKKTWFSAENGLSWLVAFAPGFRYKLKALVSDSLEMDITNSPSHWVRRNAGKIADLYTLLAEAEKNLTVSQQEIIKPFFRDFSIGSERLPDRNSRN